MEQETSPWWERDVMRPWGFEDTVVTGWAVVVVIALVAVGFMIGRMLC